MSDGLSKKHLATIHEILAPHQAITHALLFGSRARGAFKPTSDVDIALKGAITITLIAKIKAEFEESTLPFFVDIVDYSKADNALKSEIDAQGKILYFAEQSTNPHLLESHQERIL
ncbi:MAG: nucleotidyltransferase domain-containing protein [Helicobacter sp.]|nr:nucleotidyltransferase domain-containing protein [Helicobacter sp.]